MEINDLKNVIASACNKIGVQIKPEEINLIPSKVKEHGDFATNIALKSAKSLGKNPMDVASMIIDNLDSTSIDKAEVAKPGFINIFLKNDDIFSVIGEINSKKEQYGQLDFGKNEKTLLEYVSANPTGTLHLGHARGAAIGDSLARILKKAGYDVTREYYVNDAGSQVNNLALSLQARYMQLFGIDKQVPENGYHGHDIVEFATKLKQEQGDSLLNADIEQFKTIGIKLALNNIKKDLKDFRVEFDIFTSEKAIRNAHKVESVLEELKPYCYTLDGATYLNTTKDGDDKDRVIIKSDGSMTYLLPDIAYHKDKLDRGYHYLIDLFGADHHGYIARLKSSLKSLGYNPDQLQVDLVQMVRLFKDGEEFKMSKRTGNAVSLKELCQEVGVDAVRYFFVSRANSQHLDFDLDLAKSLSSNNPVYYCQYAHARLCAVMKMAEGKYNIDYSPTGLVEDAEKDLAKKLSEFKLAIKDSALTLSPCKITIYVRELASQINEFYTKCRIIDPNNVELTSKRLGLVNASEIVLKEGLNLIGVSAPDYM